MLPPFLYSLSRFCLSPALPAQPTRTRSANIGTDAALNESFITPFDRSIKQASNHRSGRSNWLKHNFVPFQNALRCWQCDLTKDTENEPNDGFLKTLVGRQKKCFILQIEGGRCNYPFYLLNPHRISRMGQNSKIAKRMPS